MKPIFILRAHKKKMAAKAAKAVVIEDIKATGDDKATNEDKVGGEDKAGGGDKVSISPTS